ncbi:MAG TPA: serine/threonine-protein kinase [Polyangia bacterium]|jgi:serine/threonine-protein kinase
MAHGRYTIVGKLADGGMAEIFLATQHGAEGFEKMVVMKRVLTAFSADPQFRNMFIDEAHISMSLSHGNIVQVLDVGLAGERTFLVLELVEGWDLEQILERAQATGPEHPWPPSLALYVTAQVCRGLSYAHAKRAADGRPLGIVHRDVNPTNVLVSEQGEVKLADFGIAKAERKREQTGAGIIKGKIGFMSPEQALGRSLDARADLFSVGTMLYLMLTGRRPFEAGSELESMLRAQRAEYPAPETLNPYLPVEATTIVNRAMRREAEARYQTADEMLGDVERVLRSQYNSAGQTELKIWLAELARRDGFVPMGRLSAVPFPAEDGSSDLSAGVSVELSDVGVGSTQATAVAIPVREVSPATVTRTPGESRRRGFAGFAMPRPTAPALTPAVPQVVAPVATPPLAPAVPFAMAATPAQAPVAEAAPAVQAPAPTPPQAASAPVAAAVETPSSPTGTKRRSRKSRVGVGFMLGALCMLGAVYGIKWLAAWAGREGLPVPRVLMGNVDAAAPVAATPPPAPPPAPVPQPVAPPAEAAKPVAAAPPASPSDAAVVPPTAEKPAPTKEAANDETADKGDEKGSDEADEGKDEAEEPAAHSPNEVVGEDEADTSHPTPARKSVKHASNPAPSRPPQPVMVRITSSPLGAEVRTKKQVLGRTPIAIRFNPGSTYELTFIKAGYVTSSRMVAVASGKSKSVSVPMKKAPAPARHGLFRGR